MNGQLFYRQNKYICNNNVDFQLQLHTQSLTNLNKNESNYPLKSSFLLVLNAQKNMLFFVINAIYLCNMCNVHRFVSIHLSLYRIDKKVYKRIICGVLLENVRKKSIKLTTHGLHFAVQITWICTFFARDNKQTLSNSENHQPK